MTTLRTLGPITIEVLYFDGCPNHEELLKCRIYRTATGLAGRPSDQWILDAIAAHTAFPLRREANRT
jgi:hypothetical protein